MQELISLILKETLPIVAQLLALVVGVVGVWMIAELKKFVDAKVASLNNETYKSIARAAVRRAEDWGAGQIASNIQNPDKHKVAVDYLVNNYGIDRVVAETYIVSALQKLKAGLEGGMIEQKKDGTTVVTTVDF